MPRTGIPIPNISGSICGAPSEKTLAGPPDKMIPRAPVARIWFGAGFEGHNFGIDPTLANSASDYLGVLRAEIQDDDLRTTKHFVVTHEKKLPVPASVVSRLEAVGGSLHFQGEGNRNGLK